MTNLLQEGKQRWASDIYSLVRLLPSRRVWTSSPCIVQATVVVAAFCQRAFERLEPCAVKVARTVLRGGSGSNVTSLPDLDCVHL